MNKFTQKWSLISLLEPVEEGYEFFWKDYPLHVTLASVFALDWELDDTTSKLGVLLDSCSEVNTVASKEGFWGDKGQYHVMLLENNQYIKNLHDKLHDFLISSGAVFNDPQFEGEGYIPHSTLQKHNRLNSGDRICLDSITILDMFPGSDGTMRKIGKTFKLSGKSK